MRGSGIMTKLKIGDTIYSRFGHTSIQVGTPVEITGFFGEEDSNKNEIGIYSIDRASGDTHAYYAFRMSRIPNGEAIKHEDLDFTKPAFAGRVIREQ